MDYKINIVLKAAQRPQNTWFSAKTWVYGYGEPRASANGKRIPQLEQVPHALFYWNKMGDLSPTRRGVKSLASRRYSINNGSFHNDHSILI